jgi:Rieske Fe-S protein
MNTDHATTRRHFVKQFTLGTVVTTLAGQTTVSRVLGALQDEDTSGILTVKLADFPVLNVANGSIRINLHPVVGNGQPGRWYPVILTRGNVPGTTFFPLEGRCTHEECILRWYGWNNTTYIACHCHESRFRRNGTVLAGPAVDPLTAYTYTFDGAAVHIKVPGLYHKVDVAPAQTAVGARLRLDFEASRNAEHRLLHRATLDAPWTQMLFSTTPGGVANKTFYKYELYDNLAPPTQPASLYVDYPGDRGFFAITVQTEVEHN